MGIIPMNLSCNIPLLWMLFTSDDNTFIPLRVRFSGFSSRYLGRSKWSIDVYTIFRFCVSIQVLQRHRLAGPERHNLIAMLFIDAADHAEALVD